MRNETSDHCVASEPWIAPHGAAEKCDISIEGVCYSIIYHVHVCSVFIHFPQKTCDLVALIRSTCSLTNCWYLYFKLINSHSDK